MSETIDYNDNIIMDVFRTEVCARFGKEAWDALTAGIGTPDVRSASECRCHTMRELMNRFENMTDKASAKYILMHVRHGLELSQFAWAKEKFAKYNSIDEFNEADRNEQIEMFVRMRDTAVLFYGQEINDDVLDFITQHILKPIRKGSELHITAFPFNMKQYIQATDERQKRYHACHCPFARESILSGNEVSPTLCYCSLGHAKVMWEAVFDTELDGEVVESVLGGGLLCKYVVYLPDEIVEKYGT